MTHLQNFVQVPSDAPGKRIRHSEIVDIELASETARVVTGTAVAGSSSGATGVITGTTDTNNLTYHINITAGTFTNGENLTYDGGTVIGTIVAVTEKLYAPSVGIIDPSAPHHNMTIDSKGAAYIRFAEGTPPLDATGRMQVSNNVTLADYTTVQIDNQQDFYDVTSGAGAVAYEVQKSMTLLSTTTISGDIVDRVTKFHHPYIPGVSTTVLTSIALSDNGKSNLLREWGYFNDTNGLFFRLNDTALSVVQRSDVTGSVVETEVPQGQWNGENVTAVQGSVFELDLTQANLFWIDFQWLGVGRVRFGVYAPSGERILLHSIENPNNNSFLFMRTPLLPLRWRQENAGAVASGSEFRVGCSTVLLDTNNPTIPGNKFNYYTDDLVPINNISYTPIVAHRPLVTKNGVTNFSIAIVEILSVWGDCPPGSMIHLVKLNNLPSNIDGTWRNVSDPRSSFQINDTATTVGSFDTSNILTQVSIAPGERIQERVFEEIYDLKKQAIILNNDGVTQPEHVWCAKILDGSSRPLGSPTAGSPQVTGQVMLSLQWKEVTS